MYVKTQPVKHAHADGILEAIETSMDSIDPGWEWKHRLIATGSDGASVNMGKTRSVTAFLKRDIPHLIPMHCVNHRLELAVLDAIRNRDGQLLAEVKSMLVMIHKHYHYSAKAVRELKMIRPANLEGTRWMPNLSGSLDALVKSYNIIVAHFEDIVQGKKGTADVQGRARNVLIHLKSERLLHYIFFLRDVLQALSYLALEFQKDACKLPDAVEAVESTYL